MADTRFSIIEGCFILLTVGLTIKLVRCLLCILLCSPTNQSLSDKRLTSLFTSKPSGVSLVPTSIVAFGAVSNSLMVA
jgi:hypothetical protein